MASALIMLLLIQIPAADTTETMADLEEHLETLGEDLENAAVLYEAIEEAGRYRTPVNTASAEALRAVPGLTERDVLLVLEHRQTGRTFEGSADLRAAGLSRETVVHVLPFVSFERPGRYRLTGDVWQRWSRRLEAARGYRNDPVPAYAGSPDALQTRVRFQAGDKISFGITLDKDPGEPMTWAPRSGRLAADFAAAHVSIDQIGPLGRAAVGAYAVHAGEGLLVGHHCGGMSTIGVASTDRILRPHTSSREHSYFRGAAIQTRTVFGLSLTTFASSMRLDGRVDSTSGSWRLASAGYHRTATERSRRGMVLSRTAGAIATVRAQRVFGGLMAIHTRQSLGPAQQSVSGTSIFGGLVRRSWSVSGEVVPDGPHAGLTGYVDPTANARFSLRLRRTGAGGYRPHSAVGVNSQRESLPFREWSASFELTPLRSWTVSGSIRRRRSPNRTISDAVNRYGSLTVEYQAASWFVLNLRGTSSSTEEPSACTVGMHVLLCRSVSVRRTGRLQVEYRHSPALRSRMRIDAVLARSEAPMQPRRGVLLFHDLRIQPSSLLRIDLRYAIFDADDSAARLYMMETDVTYAFSAPSFSRRGRRWYIVLNAALSDRIDVQLKYGTTVYQDVRRVGTGMDEIDGQRVREVRMQVRWRIGR